MSEDGATLTGTLSGEIVNAERKATLLEEIALAEGASLKQVIAVGDGANDLPMLKKAGLGIAFNAKPVVQLEVGERSPYDKCIFVLCHMLTCYLSRHHHASTAEAYWTCFTYLVLRKRSKTTCSIHRFCLLLDVKL